MQGSLAYEVQDLKASRGRDQTLAHPALVRSGKRQRGADDAYGLRICWGVIFLVHSWGAAMYWPLRIWPAQ